MSNTDHPRMFGSHQVSHDLRAYRKEDCRLPQHPVLDVTQAIAEGLGEHEVEADEAAHLSDGLDYRDYAKALFWEQEEPLAPWEQEVLDEPKPEPKPKLRTTRVLLERDKPAKNIRRPRVAKQPFSRTRAQAARQDGVDTAVYTRSINPNA